MQMPSGASENVSVATQALQRLLTPLAKSTSNLEHIPKNIENGVPHPPPLFPASLVSTLSPQNGNRNRPSVGQPVFDPPFTVIQDICEGVSQLSTPVGDHWCLLFDVNMSHQFEPATGLK
jgi:hypothetical protein